MVFSSPAEVFLAYAEKKIGVHARIKVRLPIDKHVISEVRFDKDKIRVDEMTRNPNGLRQHDGRPRALQRHLQSEDGVLRPASVRQASEPDHRRLLPVARPARDDHAARSHEGPRLPRIDAQRAEFRHGRPAHAGEQGSDHPQDRKGCRTGSEAVPARHHHRRRALQQDHRPVDACSR